LRDPTPTVRARGTDLGTDLSGGGIGLWVDGRKVGGLLRGRLYYTTTRLASGRHEVLILVRDGEGLMASRIWGFRVRR